MQFFSKMKKQGGMKSLSEEEIQKKLYGSIEKKHIQPTQDRDQDDIFTEDSISPEETLSPADIDITEEDLAPAQQEKDLFSSSFETVREEEDDEEKEEEPIEEETGSEKLEEPINQEDKEMAEEETPFDRAVSIEEPQASASMEEEEEEEEEEEGEEGALQEAGKNETYDKGIKAFELDEEIWKENKVEETITVSSTEPEKKDDSVLFTSGTTVDPKSRTKELLSSFTIDLDEFKDKVKRIPIRAILLILILLGIGIIGFNLWSRYGNEKELPALIITPASPVTDVAERAPVVPDEMSDAISAKSGLEQADTLGVSTITTDSTVSEDGIPTKPIAPPLTTFYTIQICTYESANNAERLIDSLKATSGVETFYQSVTTRSGREWFYVYLGKFPTLGEANTGFRQFKTTDLYGKFPDSFIKWIKHYEPDSA